MQGVQSFVTTQVFRLKADRKALTTLVVKKK